MDKKERRLLLITFVLILILAIYVDITNKVVGENGNIAREELGGDSKEVSLHLEADEILSDKVYKIEVAPELPTREIAEAHMESAIESIKSDFSIIETEVHIEDSYVEGMVKAEWYFQPSGYIGSDGTIEFEEVPEEGMLIQAQATLSCGEYEMIYVFPFQINAPTYSEEELLLQGIEEWIEQEMKTEGKDYIQLPSQINGVSLNWSEEKEYLALKILFLEVIAVGLLFYMEKQQKEKAERLRRRELELSYPDVVNQLGMLLQAGMTMRQAWNKIAMKYENQKKKGKSPAKTGFEAILRLNRRLQEGEKERIAYEQFACEVDVSCYRRLMRMLIGNLQKGNRQLCSFLEEESQRAYEQRVLLAKKLGEEASTKMLIPLMIMLVLVMIIVMTPAMMSFSL